MPGDGRVLALVGMAGVGAGFIAGFSFAFWFWLIKVYKASTVASFSCLLSVFSVVVWWVVLGEALTATVILSLGLVTSSLILVNRR